MVQNKGGNLPQVDEGRGLGLLISSNLHAHALRPIWKRNTKWTYNEKPSSIKSVCLEVRPAECWKHNDFLFVFHKAEPNQSVQVCMVHPWVPNRQFPPILWKLSWIITFWMANAPNLYFCGGLFWKGMPKEHRINKCPSSSLYLPFHIFLNLFIFGFYYKQQPKLISPSLSNSTFKWVRLEWQTNLELICKNHLL